MAIEINPKSAKLIQCPPLPMGAITVSLSSTLPIDIYYVDEANGNELQKTGNFKNPASIHYARHGATHINDSIAGIPNTGFLVLVNLGDSTAVCNLSISRHYFVGSMITGSDTSGCPTISSALSGISGFGVTGGNG